MKLSTEKAPHVEPKPKPRVFLKTDFDPANPYYDIEVTEEGVTVYSECCADGMSREVAEKVRDAITEYLEATK